MKQQLTMIIAVLGLMLCWGCSTSPTEEVSQIDPTREVSQANPTGEAADTPVTQVDNATPTAEPSEENNSPQTKESSPENEAVEQVVEPTGTIKPDPPDETSDEDTTAETDEANEIDEEDSAAEESNAAESIEPEEIDPVEIDETELANVIGAEAGGNSGGYTFSVRISSPDTGCDQYADWWEVLDEEGNLIYRRILAHSHVNEQPFVRSGGPVAVTADDIVWVRAHMNPGGYGGMAFKGSVETGFQEAELDPQFAAEAATLAPLPNGCAF